jgi:hypothetical protein
VNKLFWLIISLLALWGLTSILHWDFFLTLTGILLIGALGWSVFNTFFEAHEQVKGHRRRRDDDYEYEDED